MPISSESGELNYEKIMNITEWIQGPSPLEEELLFPNEPFPEDDYYSDSVSDLRSDRQHESSIRTSITEQFSRRLPNDHERADQTPNQSDDEEPSLLEDPWPDIECQLIDHWLTLARDKVAAEEYGDAEPVLLTLRERSDDKSRARIDWRDEVTTMLATTYCKRNKFREAEELVKEDFQGRDKILEMLAVAYCSQRKWEKAKRILRQHFSGRDRALTSLGMRFCEEGKLRDAEMLLRMEFQGNESIMARLGEAYCRSGKVGKVEQLIRTNFEGRDRVMDMLASAYCHLSKFEEAGKVVRRLTAMGYPLSSDALTVTHTLAGEYLKNGDVRRARFYCLTTIQGRKNSTSTSAVSLHQSVYLLAKIYEAQGQQVEADGLKSRLIPFGMFPFPVITDREYWEVERLSGLERQEAALQVSATFKSRLPAITASEWEQIASNIRLCGKGLTGSGHGCTLLHAFARHGSELACHLLLHKAADLKATDRCGRSPLIVASEFGHETVVKLFLTWRADIEAVDNNGRTALLSASQCGHAQVAAVLVTAGAKVEAKRSDGATSLITAASEGHNLVVSDLLDYGADIEAQDKDLFTALIRASVNGKDMVARLLLERGAVIEAKSKNGYTALLVAAHEGHESVLTVLLDKRGGH